MCTHQKYIYNKYIHKSILVKCGKCEACQQEKAARRASRIRNNCSFGLIPLFVTLTFTNDYVPYLTYDELDSVTNFFGVHRSKTHRYYRYNSIVKDAPYSVQDVYIEDDFKDTTGIRHLKHLKDKFGVCLYEDVKKFFKRLRINYEREFAKRPLFSYYACTEYGGKSQRPHIHLLLFVPISEEKAYRSLILKSWPYADSNRTKQYIEVARNAASYIASYVNCGSSFPKLFKTRLFRQKHSYSKGFGTVLDCFSLASILDKVDKGSLTFSSKSVDQLGNERIVNLPIPEYVLNRYFPRFKGYSRLAPDEVQGVLLSPKLLRFSLGKYGESLDVSEEEARRLTVRLTHAFEDYQSIFPNKNYFDYIIDYERVQRCYRSTVLFLSYADIVAIEDFSDFYTNWSDYEFKKVHSISLDCIRDKLSPQLCPNRLKDVLRSSERLEDVYHKSCKQRKIINYAMVELGHNV